MLCTSLNSRHCVLTLPRPRSVERRRLDGRLCLRSDLRPRGSQSAGLCPCTPARERPLKRRGLSLAPPRPRLAPGQGAANSFALPRGARVALRRHCPSPRRRVAGRVWWGAVAKYRLILDEPPRPGPGGKGEAVILNIRVSVSAPAWYGCRVAGSPCGAEPAPTASPLPSKRAPHRTPAPWLHAQWRGKVEREEETTAWCPPRSGAAAQCTGERLTVAARTISLSAYSNEPGTS
jgi:hypothetical protein